MSWRGNVRELKNVIERLAILSDGPAIGVDEVRRLAPLSAAGDTATGGAGADQHATSGADWTLPDLDEIQRLGGLVQARREFERRCIERCLDRSGGNVSQAARWLGIERSNLHKKMQAHGLEARPARPGTTPTEEQEES